MLNKGFPLLGVGRSEVLGGDCSHALNAVGEGGLLHAGVLGMYIVAVVAGDYSLKPASWADPVAVYIDHAAREDRVRGYGNGF